jgi:hypothetical protein
LEHELKSLNLMFSMKDIIKLMGPNTASYIEMSDQLGTLEAGKLADGTGTCSTRSFRPEINERGLKPRDYEVRNNVIAST